MVLYMVFNGETNEVLIVSLGEPLDGDALLIGASKENIRQLVFHVRLYSPLHRSCPVLRVVRLLNQFVGGFGGEQ